MKTETPTLLALKGRIDKQVLENAIEAVKRGDFPGWHLVDDRTTTQNKGTPIWLASLVLIFNIIVSLFFTAPSPGSASTRSARTVRIIVLEYIPTHRKATIKFQNLGLYNDAPLWTRL